jgi:hypothetical protein
LQHHAIRTPTLPPSGSVANAAPARRFGYPVGPSGELGDLGEQARLLAHVARREVERFDAPRARRAGDLAGGARRQVPAVEGERGVGRGEGRLDEQDVGTGHQCHRGRPVRGRVRRSPSGRPRAGRA